MNKQLSILLIINSIFNYVNSHIFMFQALGVLFATGKRDMS